MKKSYLMIAAAAALFAACSNTDTFKEINNQEVPIGFNSYYAQKTTKAEINDAWMKQDGDKFGVYGWKYAEDASNPSTVALFENERVYYSANDWSHGTIRYWDKSATNAYYFYAYAPYSSANKAGFIRTAASQGGATGFTYDLGTQVFADATETGTVDLCVACVEGTDYNHCFEPGTSTASDGHVSFTFDHVLSKLSFNIQKVSTLTYTVKLNSLYMEFPTATTVNWAQRNKSVTTGNKNGENNATIVYVGDAAYTGYNGPAANTYSKEIVSGKNQVVGTTSAAIEGANSYIVTPNVVSNTAQKHSINVKVGYTIIYSDGVEDAQEATGVAEINFIENFHYTLTITIDPAKIEFDVDAVNGWDEPHNENVDVH